MKQNPMKMEMVMLKLEVEVATLDTGNFLINF